MNPQTTSGGSNSPLTRVRSIDDPQSPERPRKQMRKGTRSCFQCRQRKVACSFQVQPGVNCKQCLKRGIPCTEQEYDTLHPSRASQVEGSAAVQMTARVDHLEGLMQQILRRLPRDSKGRLHRDDDIAFDLAKAAELLTNIKTSTLQSSDDILPGISNQAPVMSLFDNSLISRRELPNPADSLSSISTGRHQAVLAALRATLPPQYVIERIIDASQGGWRFIWWTVFPFSELPPDEIRSPMQQLLASESPMVVAKAIIYLALNICHLPAEVNTLELEIPGDRSEIMERYIEVVDKLVTSDDLLAASMDGIEAIALQVKYYTNLGRTRRAWLQVRRAIGIAQQCGLVHFMNPSRVRQPIDERRVAKLWGYIIMADLHLSLLLGLSHCSSDQMIASYREAVDNLPGFMDGERFHARMFPIIKRIVERNQDATPFSVSVALQIDSELEELARSQPRSWWTLQTAQESGIGVEDFYSRRSAQFLFYQVRAMLHMPFMLQHSRDKRYSHSYITTLEASRDLIRLFGYLKAESSLSQMLSRLYDFFTFTAAVTLLLSLVGYSHPAAPPSAQTEHDSQLVERAAELLREASAGPAGRVSAQCARALELLGQAKDLPASDKYKNGVRISIPYFGRVRLAPGRGFHKLKDPPALQPDMPSPAMDLSLSPWNQIQTPSNQPTPEESPYQQSHASSMQRISDTRTMDMPQSGCDLAPDLLRGIPASDDEFFFGFDVPALFGEGDAWDPGTGGGMGSSMPDDAAWAGCWPQWAVNLGAPMPWSGAPADYPSQFSHESK